MRLDTSRPYATVYNEPGIVYQQNGRYFRHDGSVVGDAAPEPVVKSGGRPTADEEARLKAQLEIYGEPWSGVRAARAFLEGKAS